MTQRRFTPVGDADELVIRARRGELLPEEQTLLERALQASATLRISYQVGRDFDDAQRVQAGDDALSARATERVLEPHAQLRHARHRRVWWFAAAAGFVALGAAASVVLLEPEPSVSPSTPAFRTHETSKTDATKVAPKQVPTPAAAAASATAERASESRPSKPRSAPTTPAGGTASELFREANAKRRAGDLWAASALYAELQAKFPGTNEARVSHVSLGKLYLGAGRAREADRQFRLYLAGGGGHLNEEALVGRAEALARLGETHAERRVWQTLRTRHPASVYQARARERLEILERRASER